MFGPASIRNGLTGKVHDCLDASQAFFPQSGLCSIPFDRLDSSSEETFDFLMASSENAYAMSVMMKELTESSSNESRATCYDNIHAILPRWPRSGVDLQYAACSSTGLLTGRRLLDSLAKFALLCSMQQVGQRPSPVVQDDGIDDLATTRATSHGNIESARIVMEIYVVIREHKAFTSSTDVLPQGGFMDYIIPPFECADYTKSYVYRASNLAVLNNCTGTSSGRFDDWYYLPHDLPYLERRTMARTILGGTPKLAMMLSPIIIAKSIAVFM